MEIIKVENLSVNGILEDVNFTIEKSQFVVICGESGSGKSTLLRCLNPSGIRQNITSGKVIVACENVGFVMQDPEMQIVTDKVWKELAFGLENKGLKSSEINLKVTEIASYFGLENIFDKKICELSGGQKQILNLASAMIESPEILILDEPLSQLDPIAKVEFLNILTRLNQEFGTTIIMVEHALTDVFYRADKVIFIDACKINASGDFLQVFDPIKDLKHSFYNSLPSTFKIWSSVSSQYNCPKTLSEGSLWLEKYATEKDLNRNIILNDEENNNENTIEVKNVYFKFAEGSKEILENVSFNIKKGEIFTILGSNGAGKTTLVKVLLGFLKNHRGKVKISSNVGYMPQNPMILFSKNCVYEEFLSENRDEILESFDLKHLKNSNPYDLSGGEIHRLALAKVMESKPEILIIDEPTKGLDQSCKNKIMDMLRSFVALGGTVLMISHDVDFCAEVSDRCGIMFRGRLTNIDTPREIFSVNKFYTTSANLISRRTFKNLITTDEVILAISGEKTEVFESDKKENKANLDEKALEKQKKPMFLLANYILMSILFFITVSKLENFYAVSMILVGSIIALFFLGLEKSKLQAREIVVLSVFCVLAIVSRSAFFMLPQFKPVLGIVILSSAFVGARSGFLIGAVTMLISNMLIAQGPWTPWQMFAMGTVGFFSGIIFENKKPNKWLISIWGTISCYFIYGVIMNFSSAIMMSNSIDFNVFLTYALLGLPMDILFSVSTFLTVLLLSDLFFEKVLRFKQKYNLKF